MFWIWGLEFKGSGAFTVGGLYDIAGLNTQNGASVYPILYMYIHVYIYIYIYTLIYLFAFLFVH